MITSRHGRRAPAIWDFYFRLRRRRAKLSKHFEERIRNYALQSLQDYRYSTRHNIPAVVWLDNRLTERKNYPFAFGGTYPSGNFEPSPKKNCSICSSMIFCELGSRGLSRYSFITILECSSHNFHASFDTLSYTRFPISPLQGIRSRPGKSLPNFTQ